MFSLIGDEVSDVANGKWITVVIRFVKAAKMKECMLQIVPVSDLRATAMHDTQSPLRCRSITTWASRRLWHSATMGRQTCLVSTAACRPNLKKL